MCHRVRDVRARPGQVLATVLRQHRKKSSQIAVTSSLYTVTSAVSCVYDLLSGKTQRIYEILLKAVVDKCDAYSVDSTTVICDFKQAVINAVTTVLGSHITVQPHHRRGRNVISQGDIMSGGIMSRGNNVRSPVTVQFCYIVLG